MLVVANLSLGSLPDAGLLDANMAANPFGEHMEACNDAGMEGCIELDMLAFGLEPERGETLGGACLSAVMMLALSR